MNVVGLSAGFHDSAACIVRDGQVLAACEEERFSRRKHDAGLPHRALRACLRKAGLLMDDIDCVAYYESPLLKADRQLFGMRREDAGGEGGASLDVLGTERVLRQMLGFDAPIQFVDHHTAHAASAFWFSGYDDAAVLVVDAVGEWATTSYGTASRRAGLQLFEQVDFPHSLGMLYSALTAFLGFTVNDGEYKVMGLAAYGEPRYVDDLSRLLTVDADGQFRLDLRYFSFHNGSRMFSDELITLLGRGPRHPSEEVTPWHADVAASIQHLLEASLHRRVTYLREATGARRLCYAGGVALNCVANAKIIDGGTFDDVFVQPAAGDAGAALGAAAEVHFRLTGDGSGCTRLVDVGLGPAYTTDEIVATLEAAGVRYADFRDDAASLVRDVAERLAAGQVVGWFEGPMEFGPRALGRRSILADPRFAATRDHVNRLVKRREDFRPFAPAVLAERAGSLFAIEGPSPFMTRTAAVHGNNLEAVTHVDGTARLQTVDRALLPRLASLIDHFFALTGVPAVLNTSFNQKGEPIVESPEDALQCFVAAELDALVLQEVVVDRTAVSPAQATVIGAARAFGPSDARNVYQLV